MHLIINPYQEPVFNLALEEYLLKETDLELIMLWRNSRSVIIGKNQNALEEIDVDYVKEKGIKVVRRMSGGGAVFHDLGNINYTIINERKKDDFGGYKLFTAPVRGYLGSLGVKAEFSGRNDLVIEGKKFSGSAQAATSKRIMHHGCILFDADFGDLAASLKPKAEKIESKGVKSVRSRVTNVAQHLKSPMTAKDFLAGLGRYFADNEADISEYTLTNKDIEAAKILAGEKYSNWEWNFGRSPVYNWQRAKRFDFGTVDLRLSVDRGIIEEATLFGDFFGIMDKSQLEQRLLGLRHEKEAVAEALRDIDLNLYIAGISASQLGELIYP